MQINEQQADYMMKEITQVAEVMVALTQGTQNIAKGMPDNNAIQTQVFCMTHALNCVRATAEMMHITLQFLVKGGSEEAAMKNLWSSHLDVIKDLLRAAPLRAKIEAQKERQKDVAIINAAMESDNQLGPHESWNQNGDYLAYSIRSADGNIRPGNPQELKEEALRLLAQAVVAAGGQIGIPNIDLGDVRILMMRDHQGTYLKAEAVPYGN